MSESSAQDEHLAGVELDIARRHTKLQLARHDVNCGSAAGLVLIDMAPSLQHHQHDS